MKIAHLSDTHLGGGTLNRPKMVDDPYRPGMQVRQQDADIMLGFDNAVSRIIASKPDMVIHSGDLFDNSQPAPHYIDFAMTQLTRLAEEGIPVIVVEGDQSYPRVLNRGHALRVLEHIKGVRTICNGCEQVRIGDVVVHAVPHHVLGREGLPKRESLLLECANVLVTHAVADGKRFFKTGRAACDVPISTCASWYDYVALGHYHRFAQVPDTNRAFYAGTTAPITQGDFRPGHHWGFTMVNLGSTCPQTIFESVPTRPMQAYGLDDAQGLSAKEVFSFLESQAGEVPPADAYCQVIVQGLDPLARKELSRRSLEELFNEASALQIVLLVQDFKRNTAFEDPGETNLYARFERLVALNDGDKSFKEFVRLGGRNFLDLALKSVETEDVGPSEGGG